MNVRLLRGTSWVGEYPLIALLLAVSGSVPTFVSDRILRWDRMFYIYSSCSSVLSPPEGCEVARIRSRRNRSGDLALYVFFRVFRETEIQRWQKRFTKRTWPSLGVTRRSLNCYIWTCSVLRLLRKCVPLLRNIGCLAITMLPLSYR